MRFIARKISPASYVNVMSQYRPCGRAAEVNGLDSPLSPGEFQSAVQAAKEEGIKRLDQPHRKFLLK
jgi:putative pyruvate formate lyase activating enzyme